MGQTALSKSLLLRVTSIRFSHKALARMMASGRRMRLSLRRRAARSMTDPDNSICANKREVESRYRSLRDELKSAERLNKALKAGRVPAMVVSVLQTIEDAGLGQHFTVVGTHALYAYEAAAGVRIVQGALATQDIDLLWDARRCVRFITDIHRLDSSVLRVLQRSDATFQRKPGQNETAINAKGFEVDFLRRQPVGDDPHPFRFFDDEDDLWPVQALRASVLTSAARFEHIVVSATGRMALMRTIAPATFVEFKHWMAAEAPNRPEPKRRRDRRQADIVQSLLDNGLLLPSVGTR